MRCRITRDVPLSAAAPQLRRLRDEGARFNIGRIHRNFSDPMIGLQIVDPAFQPRFTFALGGRERVRGVDTVRVTFVEHARPTMILRGSDKQDLPSSGDIWIRAADGVVHQTRVVTEDRKFDTRATIAVTFAHDERFDRWFPARMDETYVQQGDGRVLERHRGSVPRTHRVRRDVHELSALRNVGQAADAVASPCERPHGNSKLQRTCHQDCECFLRPSARRSSSV